MMTERCQSCHKKWDRHPGISETCRRLAVLRDALHQIMMVEYIKADGRTSHVRENARRRQIAVSALTDSLKGKDGE